VLYSLTVIELSKPGLEATTYELIITVNNAALTLNSIIATQLLTPLKSTGCTEDDDGSCPSDSVDLNSVRGYEDSDGPMRFTKYTITLIAISISCCLIFTPFLPRSRDQCKQWKEEGERAGLSKYRGYIAATISLITVMVSLRYLILSLKAHALTFLF
jgi:hypothetical protein